MGRKRILNILPGEQGLSLAFLLIGKTSCYRIAKADLTCNDEKQGLRQKITHAEYNRLKNEGKLSECLRLPTPSEIVDMAEVAERISLGPCENKSSNGIPLEKKRYMTSDRSICLEMYRDTKGGLGFRLVNIDPKHYEKLYIRLISTEAALGSRA